MTADPVAVEALEVSLGHHRVLHGVDFRVGPGEVVALLGANGSGKSTAVCAIMGLVRPAAGTVSLFGTPQETFSDWRRIGYVPQRSTAQSGVPATVTEVVSTGRLSRRRAFRRFNARDRAAVAEAVELVGLTERAHTNVAELSGGQQQRVLIARAAASEPDLLVLDEPTAGVDLTSQRIFASALARFVASGRSVLVVLHETGPLRTLIDRVAVLRGGHVVQDGHPDTVTLQVPHGTNEHERTDVHHFRGADRGLYG